MSKGKEFPPRVWRCQFGLKIVYCTDEGEAEMLERDFQYEVTEYVIESSLAEAREQFDREHLLMKQQLESAMKALEKALSTTPQVIFISSEGPNE